MRSTRGWVQLTALLTGAACSFSSEPKPSDDEQAPDASTVADDERVDCNALCAHLTEQCLEATSTDDVSACLNDCEEDLAARFAICDHEVADYANCCAQADKSKLCPSGQDADIKRCDAACPDELAKLQACGEVIVTCAQVCLRIETVCGDQRSPFCRRECEADQAEAEAAGNGARYASTLECCMEEQTEELVQSCDEDGFDPCTDQCAITPIEGPPEL